MTEQPAAANTQPTRLSDPLATARQAGVSLWLDDLSRQRLTDGSLAELISEYSVVGVTTNPAIFRAAITGSDSYQQQLRQLAEAGSDPAAAATALCCTDVAAACELFNDLFLASGGQDGRVSIEVDPHLAHDAAATVAEAKNLSERVGRANVMIKIPATEVGLEAITEVVACGISVNVTLIFSLRRYREVINAYFLGLEKALENGCDISQIHSVASFFVSRLDTAVDAQLAPDSPLRGKTGVANALLAYQIFTQSLDTQRWRYLSSCGAQIQRPLWASTGVKDPALPDTLYVDELLAPQTVNTLPEKTLRAYAQPHQGRITDVALRFAEAEAVLNAVASAGVDYQRVVAKLAEDGIAQFVQAWDEVVATVAAGLAEYYGAEHTAPTGKDN